MFVEVEDRDFVVGLEQAEAAGDFLIGFLDPAEVLAQPREGHFGVRVLADVASAAGADLSVATAPGAGCHWRLRVPRR